MAGKAQTAIELLTVYGWVILLILVVLVIAYYSGYLDLGQVLPTQCTITPTMGCRSYRFGYTPDGQRMVLVYRVVNGLGYDIQFSNDAVTLYVENVGKFGKREYNGTCYPISYSIKPGTPLSCIVFIDDSEVVPSIGKNLEFKLSIRYRNCNALPDYPKTGNCTGAPEYTVTGVIRTQMEPPAPSLYACGDEICDYVLGENPTNCCNDCPVERLTLTANPNPVEQFWDTQLTATAFYPDGTFAEGATVTFDRTDGWKDTDLLTIADPVRNTSITNSSGQAIAYYSSQVAGDVILNASTCGPNATAKVVVQVNTTPPNGSIIFSWFPLFVSVGDHYEVNATVYNTSGDPVPSLEVVFRADPDSLVEPLQTITDWQGIAYANFSSDIVHVGRLIARAAPPIRVWNSTNLGFIPSAGTLVLNNDGPQYLSSEGRIGVSGCLYNINNEPVSGASIKLKVESGDGYFIGEVGTPKLSSLTTFQTKRPLLLSNARAKNVGYETFGYNSFYDIADPVEFDAYAGKFVKIYMTDSVSSEQRARTIADYIKLRYPNAGTEEGRTIYIFYNSSYSSSWVNSKNLYNNLMKYLGSPPEGIGALSANSTVSDPYLLREIMLNHSNKSIIISAHSILPEEVFNCSASNDKDLVLVPRVFFERGGVQIHTGDWEFYYGARADGGYRYCYSNGAVNVFGWQSAASYTNYAMYPVIMNDTANATTDFNGCFSPASANTYLYSTVPTSVSVKGSFTPESYSSIVNSTNAVFEMREKKCSDGSENNTCSGWKYCVNGYLANRCDICTPCPPNMICYNASGECLQLPGAILLYVKTFNGTGTQLPNDGYTKLQVIAQVVNQSGSRLNNVKVEWESEGVLIDSILCSTTSYDCGDYSAQPSPSDPRAAVYVISNGSWTGVANVTAKVRIGGIYVTNTTNITVYEADMKVGRQRWREVTTTLLPADNYTNSTICLSTFSMNDSALGRTPVCFETTLGTFGNNQAVECLLTNEYGKVCDKLKSDTPGIANVTIKIQNQTESGPVNLTYYLYRNVSFYEIPSYIEINATPNPAPPCIGSGGAPCRAASSVVINAIFRNSRGEPVAGLPYVYFYQPDGLVNYWRGYVDPWWYAAVWGILKPSYAGSTFECRYSAYTNGTCSTYTRSDGSAYSNLSPVYPPGVYQVEVSTWYRCSGEPFSPLNCLSSVSNVTTLNVSPTPYTIIIDSPTRAIKPDGTDNLNVSFTIYDGNGAPVPYVFYRAWITPIIANSPSYTIDEGDTYKYYTNATGRGVVKNIKGNVTGNFTLTISSYYFNSSWVTVSNSTNITFGPPIGVLEVDAYPQTAYADGVFSSDIVITAKDSEGNPMRSTLVNITPPTFGMLSCCGEGCGCYNLATDSNGQVRTSIKATTVGDCNISAYILYSNGTESVRFSNSTNVTFNEPPSKSSLSANTTNISNDGVDRAAITVLFTDANNNPTPGLPVKCNVSTDAVFFPTAGLVTDSEGKVHVNLSATENPATIMCWYVGGAGSLLVASLDISVSKLQQPDKVRVNVTGPSQGVAGSYVELVANVTNSSNGQPQVNTPISFETSYGGIFEGGLYKVEAVTNSSGLAAVNVTAMGPGDIFVKANVSDDFGVKMVKYA
ncbi:MAG: Ig-like domain-containing protein [Candidatus Micrarchaeia archaeon]